MDKPEELYLLRIKAGTDPKEKNRLFAEMEMQLGAEFEPVAQPPVPEAAALWANRTKARGVSPADFIREHYGQKREDGTWDAMGLTRDKLRQLDRPLYQAFSTYLSRLRKIPEAAIPDDLAPLVETVTDRVSAELTNLGIERPEDAWKAFPDDPKKAERLRGAARWRLNTLAKGPY